GARDLSELRLLDLSAGQCVLLYLRRGDAAVLNVLAVDLDGGVAPAAERDEQRQAGDHHRRRWTETRQHVPSLSHAGPGDLAPRSSRVALDPHAGHGLSPGFDRQVARILPPALLKRSSMPLRWGSGTALRRFWFPA